MQFNPPPVYCVTDIDWGNPKREDKITLAAGEHGLMGVWFEGQTHFPDVTHWRMDPLHPILCMAAKQLAQYFAGERLGFDLPLDLRSGTEFQQRVWHCLLAIRPGTTTTYGAIAGFLDQPTAAMAVGGAIGRNPMSIVVPCHRVLGADGTLTGFAGGLERKFDLLQLEKGAIQSDVQEKRGG
ncbi:MAG: methylated-DNA--[protein]-cysteine S-methyltransferase [Rhodoferax sp.]|nr:methylated-DNA--[protein]-cysteine S-methyltransferase [Rhodoferax sp.]MCF8210536.1 methylated-DNA--[protein]-cysteine S-methyltransferase [Rhodoferax sp.]